MSPPTPDVAPFVEPTAEMRWWARRLRPLLRPGSLPSAWLGTSLVTPIAHVATGSLEFQAYLYAIFHRSAVARVGHLILMPLIVLAIVATVATLSGTAGWVLGGLLAALYVGLPLQHRMPLLAALSGAVAVLLSAAGLWWAAHPSVVPGAPAAWLVGLAFLQVLTHLAEPDIPPRVSGTADWVETRTWFGRAPVRHVLRSIALLPWAVFNEIWGSWRLLPVLLLERLSAAGYRPAARARLADLVERAMADGNPALDFIGTGGTHSLPYR
jgi:hypothetical protein